MEVLVRESMGEDVRLLVITVRQNFGVAYLPISTSFYCMLATLSDLKGFWMLSRPS